MRKSLQKDTLFDSPRNTYSIIGEKSVSFLFFMKGVLNMGETKFKATFLKMVKDEFPDCIILRTDPTHIRGIADIVILNNDKWVALEFKDYEDAPKQPNQPYYISKMDGMSYASFVYPENSREVFRAIQRSL